MTPEELQEVVAAVIAALKTNSKTIDQLTAVTTLADTDNLEISGGKKVSFGNLKELVASSVVPSSESIKGWVIIEDTDELPENPTQEEQEIGYLLDTTLYVYVGEGGDTLEGLYQSVDMKGADGSQGVGFASVADKTPNPDGTAIITLTNGDTITLDLNHDHAAYPKYELVSSLPASPDSGTLYLIATT